MSAVNSKAALHVVTSREASADEQLLELARAGDDRAWRRLYRGEFDQVYRYVGLVVGDLEAAEDLAQEVFARALVATASFRGDCSLPTWLRRIALNVCREYRRKLERDRLLRTGLADLVRPPDGQSAEREHQRRAKTQALYAALEELPEPLREAFVLRDIVGVDAHEVATELGITRPHLAVRTYRARKMLRKVLARHGWVKGDERV